ncbi:TPM domain-containing protein [Lachnospiraceae bacterium MD1]|uniref:TPM domain-containing protein n=1 Tax=Variimorphobacter saccharofermentans TaxID=2755051 RepID=A0A839K4K6_9FIRM|nr:TPM domain-containing protein [Variimorphobacter saccharofermentans]MBB2184298.1 TPM domain-containing protein [Variimorphobacter saccharofermentans]
MRRIKLKNFSLMLFLILFIVSNIPTLHVSASTVFNQHIYDEADLLSTSERDKLEEMCIEYGEEAGIDILILTHDDRTAPYAETYIEDFEDQYPAGDRVYLLVDMYNRVVFIEGYGLAETYIHSKRIDQIIDDITPDLSDGNYYDAFVSYIEQSSAYMKDDSELNYDHDYNYAKPQSSNPNDAYYDETWPGDSSSSNDSILSNILVQLVVAMIIGAVVVAIMAYNSGGKMTAGSNTYMDPSQSGLIGRRDQYIRTQVTRVRKPQNNNSNGGKGGFSSGGFRGGVSSGGRSHSSGGGRF